MGLFDFLNTKKKEMPIGVFANSLTVEEKVAVYTTMVMMAAQQGNRHYRTEEKTFVEAIKEPILGLTSKDIESVDTKTFNTKNTIVSMSKSNKEYFALIFFNLASITRDNLVLNMTNNIVTSMGFKMEELMQTQVQTQKEIENNPRINKLFGRE